MGLFNIARLIARAFGNTIKNDLQLPIETSSQNSDKVVCDDSDRLDSIINLPPGDQNMSDKRFGAAQSIEVSPGSELLSKYFSMADLTITEQRGIDNTPKTTVEKQNLKRLGSLLDDIYDNVGNFGISSAYRSGALQQRLKELGYPVAEGTSYHELGIAADIVPTTMTLDDFYGKLLAYTQGKGMVGENFIKVPQGAIHVSLPTSTKMDFVGKQTAAGYIRLSQDEIQSYMAPWVTAVAEAGKNPVLIVAIVAGLGLFLLMSMKGKQVVRSV